MSRKAQSQWDFGELFPPEQTRRVLTVSELTSTVRGLLEKEVGEIWVTGEVTNLRTQSSGHVYFTLKDGGAQLGCVLFRSEAVGNREFLQDGQKLLLQGGLTVYEPRGQYQLIVRAVEPQGIGALQLAFEKLKRKLQAEGLFAPDRKRPLPRYPQRIGLVTSPTGAAIRDVLHVIERRQPALEIILAPCRVQGDGAAAEIAAAVRLLNHWNARQRKSRPAGQQASGGESEHAGRPADESSDLPAFRPAGLLDLILVTRGGGSLEDLWAFNEEIVARAIFESALPVVSAVGHEIDFTISDFVADLRAATPSAAAELITEGPFASRQFVIEAGRRLRQLMRSHLDSARDEISRLTERFARVHPRRQFQEKWQYLDDLQTALLRCARQGCRDQRTRWQHLRQRLARLRPSMVFAQRRERLRELRRRLREQSRSGLLQNRNRFAQLQPRLRLLGPENVLARGYSITTDAASGRVLRVAGEVRPGQRLNTKLKSGQVRSVVEDRT
jgi:exodeoxyribonuclease VII large subunit